MKTYVITIFLLLITTTTFGKWSTTGKVEGIWSHKGYIFLQTSITEPLCETVGKIYWPTTDEDSKDMLSLALTALTTQKTIRVAYTENNLSCYLGGAKVSLFYISAN